MKLELLPVDKINTVAEPVTEETLLCSSPALEFFTDFTKTTPLVVEAGLTALETRNLMIKTHVKLKIVIDGNDEFIGLVSADDLLDRKILQKIGKGETRNDVGISEVMTHKSDLRALNYDQIANCSITDVINALKDLGQQHCLVVDFDSKKIRGIFSASDISRKLHVAIDIYNQASFSMLATKFD